MRMVRNVYIYICMYVHLYIYMYVCICIYIYGPAEIMLVVLIRPVFSSKHLQRRNRRDCQAWEVLASGFRD